MSTASAGQEASTAAVTRSCLRSSSNHRSDDVSFIRNLLSMLEGFLKDLEEFLLTAKHEADLQDIMTNIDSTIDTLAFIGVRIRRSGRKSRIRKADNSFDQNQGKYRNLRAHLACIVLARPTKEGRPEKEGKDIHSVDYFAKIKLSSIQERLIEANLRRRHRFIEAQRHSDRLKDHSGSIAPPVIPQQFIAISTTQYSNQDVSPLQDKKIASVMKMQSSPPGPKKEDTHTIAPTSASGLDSKWGGLQEKRKHGSTATRLTSTTAKMRYPQAHKLSNAEQKLAKKHVANDLCPYTCVVANCPAPYNLFVTQEEWNDHVINDHPPHWQCPCCGDDPPIFESISGITLHLMTKHADEVEADLEGFLSDAEINTMGITNCPLCDSEGPQDSLDLMEHVLQYVHDFSLRSLPWPADLPTSQSTSAGLFDMSNAVKMVKDKDGNVFKHDIATWAEYVFPTLDKVRGNEEESAQQDPSRQDYFLQFGNDYFVDESSDGRFSQTYHLPQDSEATERSTENRGLKRWICPICHALSEPESSGEKDFFDHLIPSHPVGQAEINSFGSEDKWMREVDSTIAVEGSVKVLDAVDPATLSSVEPQVVERLSDKDSDANAQGGEDGNALYAASWQGDEQGVKMLLDAGADVNAQGGEYGNALQAALVEGQKQVFQILLEAGAHPPREDVPTSTSK
ncbi:Protein kinase-like domain protein [Stemphylium lycopersici]|uniref:Protein kinase-like domain protein n=1 Tax=Stemphylium lycopersici TaxID=183478 RepID=A0A364ND80_STELY|nr:hypothetical protein TW65_07532 [Stemphylium lycopersici]RAR00973.1 Protein kinase-like domain protein [Stemphylium lycopersici]RAR15268.1 Protein kinase-like domain protein [Stemphylium lycopersici]